MKRLLFAVMMMVCSVSWAGWEKTGTVVDGDEVIVYYYDKSTIRKNGVIVKMWIMVNTRDTALHQDRSLKAQKVYNCSSETYAIAAFVMYSGANGNGSVTTSMSFKEKEWEWSPIIPDSIQELEWKFVCSKK